MKSDLPKVAHLAAGRPLVDHVIRSAATLQPASTVVVVGHGADQVRSILSEGVTDALQEEQLGTGHATQIGIDALGKVDPEDVVVVLYGDTPLLTPGLLAELTNLDGTESARLVSAHLDDPTGYGRVIRDQQGEVPSQRPGAERARTCEPCHPVPQVKIRGGRRCQVVTPTDQESIPPEGNQAGEGPLSE